ncbi:MAG: hypothetical protein AAB400_03550 [Patescibacteria group bacterium]
MIKLQVNETTITTGTAIISWCIGKDTLEYLSQQQALEPRLLIIIMPQFKGAGDHFNLQHEQRYLFPLNNLIAYIPLKYTGWVRIFARLVWVDRFESKPLEKLLDRYLDENDKGVWATSGRYDNSILTALGTEFLDHSSYEEEMILNDPFHTLSKKERRKLMVTLAEKKSAQAKIRNLISTSIDIEVPEGCFAKEPPVWMQKWVNLHFESFDTPYDQCEFRKRAIYAIMLQPTVVAVNYVCRLAITIGLLSVGMKEINFRPLRNVLDTSISDIWLGLNGSVFYPNWNDSSHLWGLSEKFLPLYFIPYAFSPAALLAISAGWYLHTRDTHTTFIRMGQTALGWAVGVTALSLCLLGVVWICIAIKDMWMDKNRKADNRKYQEKRQREKEDRQRREEELAKPWYLKESELAVLACDGGASPKTLADLPKERQTFTLRFLDLKAKVCRPYAKR